MGAEGTNIDKVCMPRPLFDSILKPGGSLMATDALRLARTPRVFNNPGYVQTILIEFIYSMAFPSFVLEGKASPLSDHINAIAAFTQNMPSDSNCLAGSGTRSVFLGVLTCPEALNCEHVCSNCLISK